MAGRFVRLPGPRRPPRWGSCVLVARDAIFLRMQGAAPARVTRCQEGAAGCPAEALEVRAEGRVLLRGRGASP